MANSLKNLKFHLEWVNNPKWHTVTDQVLEIWVKIIFSFLYERSFVRKVGLFIHLDSINFIGRLF